MRIFVHIREQVMKINCGDGAQCIRWLGDTACLRYNNNNTQDTGYCEGMRLDNGKTMDMNMQINEIFKDCQHIWVILSDDMDTTSEKSKKKLVSTKSKGNVKKSDLYY